MQRFATSKQNNVVAVPRLPGSAKRYDLRLVPAADAPARAQLFAGGEQAFSEILDRIDRCRESVEMRAFVWRDDETGNMLASALLRAAQRGVRIHIQKDRVGANYEYYAGSRQSFFHKEIALSQWVQTRLLHIVYPRPRGPFRQRPNVLAEALLAHPLVTVEHGKRLFDHSKLYIFDGRSVMLGGMGVGDDHRKEWVDVMVAVDGPDVGERLRARLAGEVPFDAKRQIDFLVHDRTTPAARGCPLLGQRLALIDSAERTLTVAMAYLGDARFTQALVRAVRRGVHVTLLASAMTDFLGSLNRSTCDRMQRQVGYDEKLTVVLLPQPMVHAKVVVVDGQVADVGSANFTPLSHGVYNEIDVYVRDADFARELEEAVFERCQHGELMAGRVRYNRVYEVVERMIVAHQSRRGF